MSSNIELSNLDDKQKKISETDPDVEKENTSASEKKQKDQKSIMLRNVKFKIIFYILYILAFIIFIYILKPITFCIQLYFLSAATSISDNTNLLYVGWFLVFLMPLIHIYTDGIKIISIQETIFLKIYTGVVILFEIYIMIPIPFMHTKTIYSIFLFNERGIELIIAPWLIFFPTNYIISFIEIIRNLLTSFYFAIYAIYIQSEKAPLEINLGRTFTFLITVELINVICYVLFLIKRIYNYVVEQKRKNREIREKEKRERKEKKNKTSSKTFDDLNNKEKEI